MTVKTLSKLKIPIFVLSTSILNGFEAGIKNFKIGNEESSFVSLFEIISALFATNSQRCPNLLQIDFSLFRQKLCRKCFLNFFSLKFPR